MSTRDRSQTRRQAGSVAVLTLLAIGAIVGAFLYIAVLGGRAAETTRLRVSADATSMAAATVKAKVMNYEAYVLLADTVLLPLGQLSDRILGAQAAAADICEWIPGCMAKYAPHMAETAANQPQVDQTVNEWLDGLEAMAETLQTVGPQWAEFVAVQVGESDSYKGPGTRGVTAAASFPVPTQDPKSECTTLGIEMIDNGEPTQDGAKTRDACHDRKWLELIYLAASLDPFSAGLDELGMMLTESSLLVGADCAKRQKVPHLTDDWHKYRVSRGLVISEKPGDKYYLNYLHFLQKKKPPPTLETGYLLGMSCAEHYSQGHFSKEHNTESFWHMDWRARLIPCEFDKEENVKPIEDCGATSMPGAIYAGPDHIAKMQLQFERQRLLGTTKYWKY